MSASATEGRGPRGERAYFFLLPPEGERERELRSRRGSSKAGKQAGGGSFPPPFDISSSIRLSHLLSSSYHPHTAALFFLSAASPLIHLEKKEKKRFLVYRFLVRLRIRAVCFRLVLRFWLPVWNPIPPPADSFWFRSVLAGGGCCWAVLDSGRDGFAARSGLPESAWCSLKWV